MKRLTIVLTAILLATMLFVSCKVEVDDPSMDLVSVVFSSGDASKGLNRTLEGYEPSKLFWNYTAEKKDTTNLITGQVTSETALKNDGTTGFDNVTLTLSQGKWLFTLYGYKEAARTTKIYEGSVEEVVKKTDGSAQTISIDVQPVKGDSNGYLCITDDLKVQNGSNLFDKSTDGYVEVITVKASEGVNLWVDSDNDRKVELAPGSYTVVVAYEKDGITYASGMTRVTIYSNLTTTVSGTLNESTADAVLEVNEKYASRNSDVGEGRTTYEFKGTPVNLESEDAKTTVTATFKANGEEPKLNVRTYSTLGANSTFEIEGADAVVAGFDFSLTDATIDGVVIVKTTIAPGLSGVKIYHNGVLMDETARENEEAVQANGNWYYNSDNGTLVFATDSFSSFVVTSKEASVLNRTTGVVYKNLSGAMVYANEGDYLILLQSQSLSSYLSNFKSKITVDLNDKTLEMSWYSRIEVRNEITFVNGKIVSKNMIVEPIQLYSNANMTLDDIEYFCGKSSYQSYSGIVIQNGCKNVGLHIRNSRIHFGGYYGISTNASEPHSTVVTIEIENSSIDDDYERDSSLCDGSGNRKASKIDSTAILFNVEGSVIIRDSTISANRQAAVLRGGKHSISGDTTLSTIGYTGTSGNWGGGNEVPSATLVVGNGKGNTAYQYPTELTISGSSVKINAPSVDGYKAMHVCQANKDCTVSVVFADGFSLAESAVDCVNEASITTEN